MDKRYGCQSMVKPLRRVLVKRPDQAFGQADPVKWHYTGRPNLDRAQQEHDTLVTVLRDAGAEVIYHDTFHPEYADAVFVHDPALITHQGAIILRMGKPLRQGEEEALAGCLESLGVPIRYRLHGKARAEGGDLLWVDESTLAVGQGFRTNAEGLRQLEAALRDQPVEMIPVPLPYYHGPEACLHLMSLISIVHHNIAVVYMPLLPVFFWQTLKDRGFRLVEVPDEEFETMGTNVLALAPGHCLMLAGNPVTRRRLEKAGCQIQTYTGHEISLKAEGGATCLTRPILRA
jgi:N-dimethylarginine dimethylaminohydrolase